MLQESLRQKPTLKKLLLHPSLILVKSENVRDIMQNKKIDAINLKMMEKIKYIILEIVKAAQ
jgi:hypothetical protein